MTLAFAFSHWRGTQGRGAFLSRHHSLVVGLSLLASRDSERLTAIFSLGWLPAQSQPELEMGMRGS